MIHADMAELADALDLGSSVHDVQVQVLLSAVIFLQLLKSLIDLSGIFSLKKGNLFILLPYNEYIYVSWRIQKMTQTAVILILTGISFLIGLAVGYCCGKNEN